MHLALVVLLTACLFPTRARAQADTLRFYAMSYNVENLFDCVDDSLTNDAEFLPTSDRRWTHGRYRRKIDAIGRAIIAAGDTDQPPALVALCEVENDTVMTDLTRRSLLTRAGYRYVMTHSVDPRGIDVALLYQPSLFRPVGTQSVRPFPPGDPNPTRDILHVAGLLLNGDTLDVVVVHLPSRAQGTKASTPRRQRVARCMRQLVDSLTACRRRPQVLIMGDFNDYPDGPVVRTLRAYTPPTDIDNCPRDSLFHLLAHRASTQRRFGSYKYNGEWGLLDHIVVSGLLMHTDNPLHVLPATADVFAPDFLLERDTRYGGLKPFRTYYGKRYIGGFSDHLPVRVRLEMVF